MYFRSLSLSFAVARLRRADFGRGLKQNKIDRGAFQLKFPRDSRRRRGEVMINRPTFIGTFDLATDFPAVPYPTTEIETNGRVRRLNRIMRAERQLNDKTSLDSLLLGGTKRTWLDDTENCTKTVRSDIVNYLGGRNRERF